MNHERLLESAFRQAAKLRSSCATIEGHPFEFVRGKFVSELTGQELIETAGLQISDSQNTFSVSTLRSKFPKELLTETGRATFRNGKILDCQSDNSRYTVEAINDNPESAWIKIYLREV